jgi:hypothetical protein
MPWVSSAKPALAAAKSTEAAIVHKRVAGVRKKVREASYAW